MGYVQYILCTMCMCVFAKFNVYVKYILCMLVNVYMYVYMLVYVYMYICVGCVQYIHTCTYVCMYRRVYKWNLIILPILLILKTAF